MAYNKSIEQRTGLTFLFHGPSDTGKTMFAKALAGNFGCDRRYRHGNQHRRTLARECGLAVRLFAQWK